MAYSSRTAALVTCREHHIAMDDLVLFGKNVRAARDAANLSREVTAERAGITASYLGEIERGEKWPGLEVIRSIARSLRVSATRFFEFEDEETGTPIDKVRLALENRTGQEQQQAVRVVRALFGR